jgi:collagenase-like PrtC family protease
MKKLELLVPAGSLANLKAAVSRGADSIYLGMNKFNAREYATNFNRDYLKDAVKICRSNNVRLYLTMNTLIKNSEIKEFFKQLSYAYSCGIDSVIIQEISFIDIIKKNFPDLNIHISTQAGVLNSEHAKLLSDSDRINLARELTKEEIIEIRKNVKNQLEIFCHGALCICISGSCLFSSFLGGRSGNRGKCAQPCRKIYNGNYYLSTKDLNLVEYINDIKKIGIDSIKIEGRMRNPYYVANVTSVYRSAIDNPIIPKNMKEKLYDSFNREFTTGWFNSEDVFNRKKASGRSNIQKEFYEVKIKDIHVDRSKIEVKLPKIKPQSSEKRLLVRVYNKEDAIEADKNGADIIYYDIFKEDFKDISVKCKLFGITPRIMLDNDIDKIKKMIDEKRPDGLLIGNIGMINLRLNIPLHLDYNANCFNDLDVDYFERVGAFPIISPELSIKEAIEFNNKNFGYLVHGKIRLMTLRNRLEPGWIKDERNCKFKIEKIKNGYEVLNEKELGLLSKSINLVKKGVNNFFIDSDSNVGQIVRLYRDILDGKNIKDSFLKKRYVLAWTYKGVI